jgi:AraC-like DNA-binding protein
LAVGPHWKPLCVYLDRTTPAEREEYDRLLTPRIKFGQPVNEIVVDRKTLHAPLPGADRNLYLTITHCCEMALRHVEVTKHPFREISGAIVAGLSEGKTDIKAIATRIGLTEREVQRQIQQHGTSFHEMVDDTRRSLAHHYLTDTNLSLTEVAYLLGYSELSAFSRAAQRWFQMSARDYRKERQRL